MTYCYYYYLLDKLNPHVIITSLWFQVDKFWFIRETRTKKKFCSKFSKHHERTCSTLPCVCVYIWIRKLYLYTLKYNMRTLFFFLLFWIVTMMMMMNFYSDKKQRKKFWTKVEDKIKYSEFIVYKHINIITLMTMLMFMVMVVSGWRWWWWW